MNNKNPKTILFAGIIAAMILPFSGMNPATAQEEQTWSFNEIQFTNASGEGFFYNSKAMIDLEYTGTQKTCTISIDRAYIDSEGLTKYMNMIAEENGIVSFPCDTYPTFRMFMLPDDIVTMKISLTEEDGTNSELYVKDYAFSAVVGITEFPWILNDVTITDYWPDGTPMVHFDLDYIQDKVYFRSTGSNYCSISVDLLIEDNTDGYPQSMIGEYVPLVNPYGHDLFGFLCHQGSDEPVIPLRGLPLDSPVTLKITLLELDGYKDPTVIELVDYLLFEKTPPTPWYFNDVVITEMLENVYYEPAKIKFDFDYSGPSKNCIITVSMYIDGIYLRAVHKQIFDCKEDPIFRATLVEPGTTGTFKITIKESYDDYNRLGYINRSIIQIHDFTFEWEQPK